MTQRYPIIGGALLPILIPAAEMAWAWIRKPSMFCPCPMCRKLRVGR